jgi:hypothetical protein
LFTPEFKKMVEEEGYSPKEVYNVDEIRPSLILFLAIGE